MSFAEIHRALWRKERIVTFKSLTSSKTHKVNCTITWLWQTTSDKIIVFDIDNQKTMDIEVSSVQSIA